jgi:hypothetical protein
MGVISEKENAPAFSYAILLIRISIGLLEVVHEID